MTYNIKKVVLDISLGKPPQETLMDTLTNIRITPLHSDFCFTVKEANQAWQLLKQGKINGEQGY